ncbi:MAG: DUF4248 domain-containing protein [Phocaeicola sp.]
MRTIYVRELASLYFPNSTGTSAVVQFRRWIIRCTPLQERLSELGWSKGQRILTPLQHTAVIDFLGEPGE